MIEIGLELRRAPKHTCTNSARAPGRVPTESGRLLRNAMLSMNRSTCHFGFEVEESWSPSKSLVCQTPRNLT